MKPIVSKIKQLFYIWKQNNKDPHHEAATELKAAKKELKSMQRHLAAQHRKQLLQDITSASTDDKQLYYRLVNKQRGCAQGVADNKDFGSHVSSQLEGWACYFESLATATSLPQFSSTRITTDP